MESEAGPPLPERFPSRPGQVFPMFHVFADVNEFRGGEVLPSRSTRPLAVDGLVLRRGRSRRDPAGQLHAERSPRSGSTAWGGRCGSAGSTRRTRCRMPRRPVDSGRSPVRTHATFGGRMHAGTGPVCPRQARHRVSEGPMSTSEPKSTIPDRARPLLVARAIRKRFAGVRALEGVDLEVRRGEVHALVGENGAGKSTLMHILAGVHQPDGGSLDWDGRSHRLRRRARGPAGRDRHRLPGAQPLRAVEHRGEHLRGPPARRPLGPHRSPRAAAKVARPAGASRPGRRPRHARRTPLPGPAATRRDRQGPLDRRPAHHLRRADRRPDGRGDGDGCSR